MVKLTISTPTLVFSAISLLMIAYTSRYITLTGVIRDLHKAYQDHPEQKTVKQIKSLMQRVKYIRNMQVLALLAFAINIFTMILIFFGSMILASVLFFIGLFLIFVSLIICIIEVTVSAKALEYLLELEKDNS